MPLRLEPDDAAASMLEEGPRSSELGSSGRLRSHEATAAASHSPGTVQWQGIERTENELEPIANHSRKQEPPPAAKPERFHLFAEEEARATNPEAEVCTATIEEIAVVSAHHICSRGHMFTSTKPFAGRASATGRVPRRRQDADV